MHGAPQVPRARRRSVPRRPPCFAAIPPSRRATRRCMISSHRQVVHGQLLELGALEPTLPSVLNAFRPCASVVWTESSASVAPMANGADECRRPRTDVHVMQRELQVVDDLGEERERVARGSPLPPSAPSPPAPPPSSSRSLGALSCAACHMRCRRLRFLDHAHSPAAASSIVPSSSGPATTYTPSSTITTGSLPSLFHGMLSSTFSR